MLLIAPISNVKSAMQVFFQICKIVLNAVMIKLVQNVQNKGI